MIATCDAGQTPKAEQCSLDILKLDECSINRKLNNKWIVLSANCMTWQGEVTNMRCKWHCQ